MMAAVSQGNSQSNHNFSVKLKPDYSVHQFVLIYYEQTLKDNALPYKGLICPCTSPIEY